MARREGSGQCALTGLAGLLTRCGSLVSSGAAALCLSLSAAGCGAPSVEARAVWVDVSSDGGERRLHVYDQGELAELTILGEEDPIDRLILGPRGGGVFVRAGAQRGGWIDLRDGRRLAMSLPPPALDGDSEVEFSALGTALGWFEGSGEGSGEHLAVLPLAPGIALDRRADGSAVPLEFPSPGSWMRWAPDAPVVVVEGAEADAGLSFLRVPQGPGDPGRLLEVGSIADALGGAGLPENPSARTSCSTFPSCGVFVAVDPRGASAIVGAAQAGPWQRFDVRRARLTGGLSEALELPPMLGAEAAAGTLRLLLAASGTVSVWLSAGFLYRWDADLPGDEGVEREPIFAPPDFHWTAAAGGRALVFSSAAGPVYRVDGQPGGGIEALNLESSECLLAGQPVFSPTGGWAAWSCLSLGEGEEGAATLAADVVRVSKRGGLERFSGVPMVPVTIDDSGAVLLHSVNSVVSDGVDGVDSVDVPRNLFALSGDGILAKVDDLEPTPVPILTGVGELGRYIQGAALSP